MVRNELPKSPYLKANFLSRRFFWWLNRFFREGYKRELEIDDLYETLPEDKSAELGGVLAAEWTRECERCKQSEEKNSNKGKPGQEPSLSRVLSRVFAGRFILVGLLACIEECVLRIAQPVALGFLIRYFSNRDKYEDYVGYVSAFGVFISAAMYTFTHHPYFFGVCHIGMQVRVSCCSLVYRKALKLSQASLRHTAIGQMVNLLSNDVNRFDESAVFLHYLWIGPVQTLIITGILWMYYGPSCLIGLVILVLFVPLQGYLGSQFSKLRAATAIRTDRRIRLMNEIVTGIRVIKMYTWEYPFSSLIGEARKDEIKFIRKTSYLRALNMSLFFTSSKVIVFLTLLLYVLLGHHLTAELVFVTLALYNNVRLVMTLFFPLAVAMLAETKVSVTRLEEFLLQEERETTEKALDYAACTDLQGRTDTASSSGVFVTNVSAKWYPELPDNTLTNISLTVRPGQIFGIVGPVGSGKGSILHVILRELPALEGKVRVQGTIAYAAQEPWLFTGSVKDNILFGQLYDQEWYQKVLQACALKRDLELLPYGDETLIGDRGSTLSGGQKARIALARAVYFNADIYLLDDPLSAVDAEVGQHLFTKCINGILAHKARILVTHQLQYLKYVDHIVLMEDGGINAEGTYDELQRKGVDFEKIVKPEIRRRLSPTPSVVSHSPPRRPSIALSRTHSVSLTSQASGGSFINISEKYAPVPTIDHSHELIGEISESPHRKYGLHPFEHLSSMEEIPSVVLAKTIPTQDESEEEVAQGSVSGSDYWLNIWTTTEELKAKGIRKHTNPDDPWHLIYNNGDFQLYGYAAIVGMLFFTSWIRTLLFFLCCMKSSISLHKSMFNGIIRAPISFFETNPAGRILNRFSKDMGLIDDALPITFFDAFSIFLNVIAIVIVIGFVNPILLVPALGLFFIFSFLREFYLRTARSVKRLEGIARSPVFSHISTSLNGLTTIRAFGAEEEFRRQFDSHLDFHSSAWFLFLATTRWFGIWLDWISVSFIGVVTFSFLISSGSGAEVGLAVSSAMMLTGMFQWGMRQSAEVENQLVSVERVMEYAELQAEASLESDSENRPPKDWPRNGEITFSHMYAYYNLNPVLKDINISIRASEKIGIVGRTGAGKSTLITTLFRLVEPSGDIIIDGVNISKIGLHELRSQISIIPQEPVLFGGTLRKNLDPFSTHTDDNLWHALEESHLARDVKQLPDGLSAMVSEGGTNFSVGQRQLLCLARAILRNNKILILDEATANVDLQTDSYIQATLETKFKDCTVLTIAHRLQTVMNCNRILILEAGSVMEFDEPFVLLQNANSLLRKLVDQTGKSTAEDLQERAKLAHNYRKKKKSQ
ncbi:unnamed protein product [Allacma fusca]|uniref:ATP-binding cassette sub-family C member 7 n=1 Tax=Allacma fusca TaxID=39272 RepID=A0A8J2KTH9_9HEXA|nr:unnamed protein product [Allacma fusca]